MLRGKNAVKIFWKVSTKKKVSENKILKIFTLRCLLNTAKHLHVFQKTNTYADETVLSGIKFDKTWICLTFFILKVYILSHIITKNNKNENMVYVSYFRNSWSITKSFVTIFCTNEAQSKIEEMGMTVWITTSLIGYSLWLPLIL